MERHSLNVQQERASAKPQQALAAKKGSPQREPSAQTAAVSFHAPLVRHTLGIGLLCAHISEAGIFFLHTRRASHF